MKKLRDSSKDPQEAANIALRIVVDAGGCSGA